MQNTRLSLAAIASGIFFLQFLFNSIGFSQSDTLTIQLGATASSSSSILPEYPSRLNASKTAYDDSIHVATTVINKHKQRYYLIVTHVNGDLHFEGEFFDRMPCGAYKLYQDNNIVQTEAQFKLEERDLPEGTTFSLAKRVGTWTTYNENGKIAFTESHLNLNSDDTSSVLVTHYNKRGKPVQRVSELSF